MLATAPAPAPATASHQTLLSIVPAPRLRPALVIRGRVCSWPVLLWTALGVPVARFRMECDELADLRLRALAQRGTRVIDVTVWGADAFFVALDDDGAARQRCIAHALAKGEPAVWDARRRQAWQIRPAARVEVEGTPRAGHWFALGEAEPQPLGIVAERVGRLRITGSTQR